MSIYIYCANGHLKGPDIGKPCLRCVEEERAPALKIIREIADLLPYETPGIVREKLQQLEEILTDLTENSELSCYLDNKIK